MYQNYEFQPFGKVIRIISMSRIIVDVGESELTVGDQLIIYTPGERIYDLDGKDLGSYENIKDIVTVIQTAENYSVCAKYVKEAVNALSTFATMVSPRTIQSEKALLVKEEDITPLSSDTDRIVHIGDYVRKA